MKFVRLHSMVLSAVIFLAGCGGSNLPDVPDDAKGTAEAVVNNIVDKKPGVLWSALPPSYQNDVNEIVQSAVSSFDKDIYDKVVNLLRTANRILKEKKSFILKSEQLGYRAKDLEEVSRNWDVFTDLLDVLLDSQFGSFDEAKVFEGEQFFSGTGTVLMEKLVAISALTPEDPWVNEILPNLKGITVEEVSKGEKSVILKFSDANGANDVRSFVRVEGKWIPAEMQIAWKQVVAVAKAELAKQSATPAGKMNVLLILGLVEGVLNELDKAKTEEEFNQAIENLANLLG